MPVSFPIHSLLRRVSSLATLALILPAGPVGAQSVARIQGRVLESGSGEPIAGATIEVAGTVLSALSAVDGRFLLDGVPPGEVTLRVRLVGFQPKTMTGLSVSAGTVLRQDLTLAASAVQLDELTVTAEAEQGSLDQALNKQRNSNHVMNAVSAEQIARTPDSDAGQAIQRVSGVTLRDRKFVIVRGLGERYTVTSLNGTRVPSLEPEQKSVPLDLFPTSMLDGISTTKTFTPDQPGDFGGASVDLRTREFPGGRQYSFSMSVGANAAALRQDVVKAPSEGLEWLGFAASSRTLPLAAQQAGDLTGLTDA
ncbi:MAG: carboxypeptidase regulatory-like domain-containing protein, partial [Gemmatimonadota bacterium]